MTNPTPQQIKQARESAGLSVIQVAKIMGTNRQTVYNWEAGTHKMRPRDFEYLQMKLTRQ